LNFGPTPKADFPFKCHMLGKGAMKDLHVAKAKIPKDGKFEVLFPVLLPDEGTFDAVNLFLQQHPEYTELSDRMVLEWCEKSGITRNKGYQWRSSNDKPEMSTGVSELDNFSVRRILRSIAPAQKRNFVLMEVKSNLLPAERKELLSRFSGFKKTAQVMVGDPVTEFKKKIQELILRDKQEKSDAEFKQKQAEEVRKYQAQLKEKELERAAKKAKREAEKKAEEEQRAAGEEAPDQEMKPAEEEEEPDHPMPDPALEKPPVVQLNEEEIKMTFRPTEHPDLSEWTLSASLNDFTLPDKSEGFENVTFTWNPKTKAENYFKEWKLRKKITTKLEELKVGDWFNQQHNAWKEQLQTWKNLQAMWKVEGVKKEQEEAKPMVDSAPTAEATAPPDGNGEAPNEAPKDEAMPDAEAPAAPAAPAPAAPAVPPGPAALGVADDDLDVFGVNVNDVNGTGEPLCSLFALEDWVLLMLRIEFHLMVHSFKKDVTDQERPGIHVENVPYYYNKYFRKTFTASHYGFESNQKVVELLKDTVTLSAQKVLVPELDEDLDNFDLFLKLTEEGRRERELLVDLGEDEAVLRFNHSVLGALVYGNVGKGYQKGPGKGMDQKGKGFDGKGWQGKGYDKGYDKGYNKGYDKGYDKGYAGGGAWGKSGCGCMGGKPQMGGKKGFNSYGKGYGK